MTSIPQEAPSQVQSANSKWNKILDAEGLLIRTCDWITFITGFISPFVAALFMYIPVIDHHNKCFDINFTLAIALGVLRLVLDFPYFLCIIVYLTRWIRGPRSEDSCFQVSNPPGMLSSVVHSLFLAYGGTYSGVISILPMLQLYLFHFTSYVEPDLLATLALISFIWAPMRMVQCVRLPMRLSPTIIYVCCCVLISNLFGAWWYLLSINSELRCWSKELTIDQPFLVDAVTCRNLNETMVSRLNSSCSFTGPIETFNYGIFRAALEVRVVGSSTGFLTKWSYCFLWALRNLSSLGQNLEPSLHLGEIVFATLIPIFSLFSFSILVGVMQNLLQYANTQWQEKKIKEKNTEAWMIRQNVPECLRKRIREYHICTRQRTWFIDEEETLIHNLPKDIKKDLKRHLCQDLVTNVPQFEIMDSYLLDVLCERLKPVLYIKETCIFHEGKPIEEMIFIKRGNLQIKALYGRIGDVFTPSNLKDGDFCGEELVTWALDPNYSSDYILPVSTKTVETISEVEAYALSVDDLKFIASQLPTSYISKLYNRPRSEQSLSTAQASLQIALANATIGTSSVIGSIDAPGAANVLRYRQTGSSNRLLP